MNNKTEWEDTFNRYIIFMDIMGFKDMIYRNPHDEILKIMDEISCLIEVINNRFEKVKKGDVYGKYGLKKMIKPVMFSDSILLISEDESNGAIIDILNVGCFFIYHCLMRGIPIKGAVAHGTLTANFTRSLYFGKPLIDAYELQDEILFYGLVLHHTAEKYLNEVAYMQSLEVSDLIRFNVPLKEGRAEHHVVSICVDNKMNESLMEKLPELYNKTSGSRRKYIDNTIEYFKCEKEWLNHYSRL